MGNFNIVKDYDWCSSPKGSAMRNNAPAVWVKSYKLNSNQIKQTIDGYGNIMSGGGNTTATKFYDKMYNSSTTEDDNFWFPFFGDNIRGFSNTFGDTFQNGIGGSGGVGEAAKTAINTALGVAGQVAGIVGTDKIQTASSQAKDGNIADALKTVWSGVTSGGDPGTYIETPMFYQFEKSDGPLEIAFILSNTINNDAWKNNSELVRILTKINRPERRNSYAVDPPRIYRVVVPGHRLIRWAYCSNFAINLIGARKMIGNEIVPEGYQITMSFQSLTLEHSGFVDDVATITGN